MNKKLIKILACSACGLGIATSIPFMTTSCGSPAKGPIYEGTLLPDNVYDIDENGVLKGFKSDIKWSDYADCDVMKLPANINAIGTNTDHYSYNLGAFVSKIPQNIKILDLTNLTELTDMRAGAFMNNKSITLLVMPSKIKSVGQYAFSGLTYLTKIYWDWFDFPEPSWSIGVAPDMFRYIALDEENKGTAYSLSSKGTIKDFEKFLDIFVSNTDKPFSTWDVKKY